MITVQRTSDGSPGRRVFAYLSDFTNAAEWDAGTVALLAGRAATAASAPSYLNTSRFLGRESDLTYVVTELVRDAPSSCVEGRNDDRHLGRHDDDERPQGRAPSSSTRAEFTFQGAARFLEPLLRIPIRQLGDDAERSLTAALSRL